MRPCFLPCFLSLALGALPAAAQTSPSSATPPAAKPAQPAPQQRAPEPPRPFPEGAKVAFLNIQRIAAESGEGQAALKKLDSLREKRMVELNEKNKALQMAQTKLQQGGAVLSDAARAQLEREVERIQLDIQRFSQDAQAEVQDAQQELQDDFQEKLNPIIEKVASQKGLHIVFAQDAGIVWVDIGIDITDDVIKQFNAATGAAAPGAAAQPPAAGQQAKPPDR